MIEQNTVKKLYAFLDERAPFASQLPWDNSGHLIGDEEQVVHACVMALDVTADVIRYAKKIGAELIITHHPVIFNPLKRVTSDSLIWQLIRANISVISAHTNLDLANGGVNDALANSLALKNIRPFENEDNIGRIGELEKEMMPGEFAAYIKEKLGDTADIAYTGEKPIRTVALCGGAGSAFIRDAVKAGADAYLTGEVKHHEWMEAQELSMAVFSAGHYATEQIIFDELLAAFAVRFPETKFLPYKSCKVKTL